MWKSTFRHNYWPTFSPTVPPFAARISGVVWTCRHLVVEVESLNHGGGLGLHNKPVGCGASGAYVPGPIEEEEEGKCQGETRKDGARPALFQNFCVYSVYCLFCVILCIVCV